MPHQDYCLSKMGTSTETRIMLSYRRQAGGEGGLRSPTWHHSPVVDWKEVKRMSRAYRIVQIAVSIALAMAIVACH